MSRRRLQFGLTTLLPLLSLNLARKISIRKSLTDQETLERETASFEVELSHTDVEGIWQKDGIRVKPNNLWRVSTNGHVHGLTMSNLTLEDTGTIAFSAEGVRTTARLTVKGSYWPVIHDKRNAHRSPVRRLNREIYIKSIQLWIPE